MSKKEAEVLRCSFCDKSQKEVNKLIAGPTVYICDECVDICMEIIAEGEEVSRRGQLETLPKPIEIKEFLDQYVIGQEAAKKKLSVAVYNHYKRIEIGSPTKQDDVEINKGNVLLLGPTGTGKTLLAETLARFLDVPFAIVDATTLTEAGYVGEDVENIILRLLQKADNDIERTQRGIIYIDEIDKIGRKNENPSITRDVSGEGVQQSLLKILEGTTANVPPEGGRKHPQQEYIRIDTTNILFVVGGAFVGLEDIVRKRIAQSSLGFNATLRTKDLDRSQLLTRTQPGDLIKYGLIPEFVGRVPVMGALHDLDKGALVRILKEPRNALTKQYEKIFKYEGVELKFTEPAIEKIAEEAMIRDVGARGLRLIMEELMLDIMYHLPSHRDIEECVITEEMVEKKTAPLMALKKVG